MRNVVEKYLDSLINYLDARDEKGRKIIIDSLKFELPTDTDLGRLMRAKATYAETMIINYSVLDSDGVLISNNECRLEIPALIYGGYLVNGSLRYSGLSIGRDDKVWIDESNVYIRYGVIVSYTRKKDVLDWRLRTRNNDGSFNVYDSKDLSKVPIGDLIIDEVLDKIQVKFDLELEDLATAEVFGETKYILDPFLIETMINFGPDKKSDNIIDKTFRNIQSQFHNYINKPDIRNVAFRNVGKFFYRNGYLGALAPIQSVIMHYFSGGANSSIRYAAQTNPITKDILPYKIKLKQVEAYNQTFTDIIDPINSPENQNVNTDNELNVCADLSTGELRIVCIDFKTKKEVRVPYIKYLNSKVLHADYYDYERKEVLDSDHYVIKYHQKMLEVKKIPSDVKYIEPSYEDRLSRTTRCLPLINLSEPGRNRMGTGMLKQAVEVKGHQRRLVSSGNEDKDYLGYSLTQFYLGDEGLVEDITDRIIKIKDLKSGTTKSYEIPSTIYGMNGANTSFTTKLKVGDKLKENDEIITASIQRNRQYEFGRNARVAYMTYFGYGFEDAVIISKSFSKAMTYYTVEDIVVNIKPTDIVNYIVPVGSKVKSTDRLVGRQVKTASINRKKGSMVMDLDELVPNNIENGWVIDIKIARSDNPGVNQRSPNPDNSDSDGYLITETDSYIRSYLNKYLRPGEVSPKLRFNPPEDLPKDQVNSDIEKVDVDEVSKYVIHIRLIKENDCGVGSKLTNSWGSKGEVGLVLDDDIMPYVGQKGTSSYQPIDLIMTPSAPASRQNYSQIVELVITACINATYEKVVGLLNDNKDDEAMDFVRKYYPKTYKDTTADEMRSIIEKDGVYAFIVKIGCYNNRTVESLMQWANDLGTHYKYRVSIPYNKDLGGSTYDDFGDIEVANPIVVGTSYIMRLYHASDANAKVTNKYRKYGVPLLGVGQTRDEGQKIGEMESWILDGLGLNPFVRTSEEYKLNELTFLNQILMAGFSITDGTNPLMSDIAKIAYKRFKQQKSEESDDENK